MRGASATGLRFQHRSGRAHARSLRATIRTWERYRWSPARPAARYVGAGDNSAARPAVAVGSWHESWASWTCAQLRGSVRRRGRRDRHPTLRVGACRKIARPSDVPDAMSGREDGRADRPPGVAAWRGLASADWGQPGRQAAYASPSDRVSTLIGMAQWPFPDRPARARHRPAPRRPLARGGRDQRVVARGRRRVHARRLRQGLLRRAHRGRAGLALRRPRLPRPGRASRPSPSTPDGLDFRPCPTRSPARLVVALVRRGRARRLPALHRGRRQLDADAAAERARRAQPGKLSVTGKVVGPVTRRRALGRRAPLRRSARTSDGKSGVVPVVYHGDRAATLFKVGRDVIVERHARERPRSSATT